MNLSLNHNGEEHLTRRCDKTGKVSFLTRRDGLRALVVIRRLAWRKGPDGRRIKHRGRKPRQKRVYYCTYCEGYHLTSWSWWFLGSAKYVATHLTIKTKF